MSADANPDPVMSLPAALASGGGDRNPCMALPAGVLTGIVLAGGQASRMRQDASAPVDKGLLDLHGQPLVAHAVRSLRPWVSAMLVSANRNLDRYAAYGSVVSDDPRYGAAQGPLAGLASALAVVRTPWVMVLPVDVPFLPPDLVPRLAQAVTQQRCLLAYAATDRAHPLCMLASVSLRDSLDDCLLRGERRVMQWVQSNGGLAVRFAGHGVLGNLNTMADLQAARQAGGQDSQSGNG